MGSSVRPALRCVPWYSGLVMLLVSIHDVTPAFESKVKKLWDLCFQSRVIPALLVVPDWHGQWPLERYPEFVGWIQARVMDGAELVLHGERHDEIGLPRGVSVFRLRGFCEVVSTHNHQTKQECEDYFHQHLRKECPFARRSQPSPAITLRYKRRIHTRNARNSATEYPA